MQSATFELTIEELDQKFIEALKTLFSGKNIKILVTENDEVIDTSLSLKEIIKSNRQTKTVHQFSGETLDFLLDKMTSDSGFDLVSEMEQYRVARS
jgi:predicted RNA-binding protein with RPS1 domain